MKTRLPPGGVGRTLKMCRKLIIKYPGTTDETLVAETLARVLLGDEKGDQFITCARYLALRQATR